MKIEESRVALDARHALEQSVHTESRFSFRNVLQQAEAAMPVPPARDERTPQERMQLLLQELVAAILAVLKGEKCRSGMEDIAAASPSGQDAVPADVRAAPLRVRRLEWQRTTLEHIEEHERTAFSGQGTVRTADGRAIDFDLSLSMCRDFDCTRVREEKGAIEFHDPLVLNFTGKATELTDARFSFDLDADGEAESLPMLAAGNGYLVFDVNRDGRVADGREVIGATSGEAFDDLAKLDADGNGWVDEADPAWAALGVWFPDGEVKPLKEAGVGALHVAGAWSPFVLKDGDNNARGQIWRTGVYLGEDGRAGTMQQIDLASDSGKAA